MSSHKWDRDGERCVKCGDKDWMQTTECSVPDAPAFAHTESPNCPCGPALDYVDPETGLAVYVHRKSS